MPDWNTPRVAICSVGELFGGVERHILGLLAGLRAQGVAAPLFLFTEGELALQARQSGFEVDVLAGSRRSVLTTSRTLAERLAAHEIRIVHTHGYKATVHCAIAKKWNRFAMIKTEHGLPELEGASPLQTVRTRIYHWLDDIASRRSVDVVCYVTEGLRKSLRNRASKPRTAVIANGIAPIDRLALNRPAELAPNHQVNLAVVGRLDDVKGQHIAVEAIANESIPANFHLHIIGTGPREPDLRALAHRHGIIQRVHFAGFKRNVYEYIAYCDALLMPSLHEGLPYTLLEAMALGTPVIASRVGGLAEALKDEVTALLVPPRDASALAHAILRLHHDRQLASRLRDHASALQQTEYSLDAMTQRYLAIYRDLVPADI